MPVCGHCVSDCLRRGFSSLLTRRRTIVRHENTSAFDCESSPHNTLKQVAEQSDQHSSQMGFGVLFYLLMERPTWPPCPAGCQQQQAGSLFHQRLLSSPYVPVTTRRNPAPLRKPKGSRETPSKSPLIL